MSLKPSTHFGPDSMSQTSSNSALSKGQKGYKSPKHVHHPSNMGFVNDNKVNSKPSGHATGASTRGKKHVYTGGKLK